MILAASEVDPGTAALLLKQQRAYSPAQVLFAQGSSHLLWVVARRNLSAADRERVLARDNHTCSYCGAADVDLEIDHIFPVCRGGGDDDENLTAACGPCNRSKGASTIEEWCGAEEREAAHGLSG